MRNHSVRVWGILLLTGFAAGVAWLMLLRLSSGDVYPPYSSMRSDPLGTRVFYDSLALQPQITVARNFANLPPRADSPLTLFLLGGAPIELQMAGKPLLQRLEETVKHGGRVVLAFTPTEPRVHVDPPKKPAKSEAPGKPDPTSPDPTSPDPTSDFALAWNVHFDVLELPKNTKAEDIPSGTPRETALYFKNPAPEWRVRKTLHGRAVIMERARYSGSVVLVADSYFLSNEAQFQQRDVAALSWLVGSAHRVVFDEAHLGVVESGSVMGLARRMRLQPVVYSLLLLAILFIWKNSSSLLPPTEDAPPDGAIVGRDSFAGLVNLLRRGILPGDLLDVCVERWRRSAKLSGAKAAWKLERVNVLIAAQRATPERQRNPVQAYQQICEILAEQTHRKET